jgi:ferrous iron transport protein A
LISLNSCGSISGGGLPLAFLSEGEEGDVVEVRGGRGLAQRLADMGLTPSTKVKVIKSCPPGPMLVSFRDSRIALGRGITMKIFVSMAEGP